MLISGTLSMACEAVTTLAASASIDPNAGPGCVMTLCADV